MSFLSLSYTKAKFHTWNKNNNYFKFFEFWIIYRNNISEISNNDKEDIICQQYYFEKEYSKNINKLYFSTFTKKMRHIWLQQKNSLKTIKILFFTKKEKLPFIVTGINTCLIFLYLWSNGCWKWLFVMTVRWGCIIIDIRRWHGFWSHKWFPNLFWILLKQ